MRTDGRLQTELRQVGIERRFTRYAEGSVLISFGETRVLCNASVEPGVPRFMRGEKRGWLTAEYAMLPRATNTRSRRNGGGRSQEIQRLIGRALRAALDLSLLGDYTITLDCDVLQADAGTRVASVTGACVAVADALAGMRAEGLLTGDPLRQLVAGVSVAVRNGELLLDPDYSEDFAAAFDLNLVGAEDGSWIEVQGTDEGNAACSDDMLVRMLGLGREGLTQLFRAQREALAA